MQNVLMIHISTGDNYLFHKNITQLYARNRENTELDRI